MIWKKNLHKWVIPLIHKIKQSKSKTKKLTPLKMKQNNKNRGQNNQNPIKKNSNKQLVIYKDSQIGLVKIKVEWKKNLMLKF